MNGWPRNLWLLAISQVLGGGGAPVMVFAGGLIGAELAPSETLATLPLSLMVVGVAVSTLPVGLLLRKTGRRLGYMLGAGVGVAAALVGVAAIIQASFPLFCAAALLIGANNAFILQYRFGAAESVPPERSGQAVSLVLVGGMLAGYLGPEIARRTENLLGWGPFSATFLILAGMYASVLLVLAFFQNTAAVESEHPEPERPLRQVVSQPRYITAVLAGTVAYGVMSLIMTATPVQMHTLHGFSLADTAWVIQSHIIAMYLPSLFTAALFSRLGLHRVMLLGVLCLLACVGLGVYSTELFEYWGALVLLGVGWNFLFVGATVMLTSAYRPAERFRAQAFNDFTIFAIQAVASLSAGSIIFQSSWSVLLLLSLPVLILMLGVLLAMNRRAPQALAQ